MTISFQVAPPRLKGERVGLWSTRTPHRPNPIGLTLAKLVKIEHCKIYLQGLDLLDKTPILDIKPYIPHYDMPKETEVGQSPEPVLVPAWIESEGLRVDFTPRALNDLGKVNPNAEHLSSVEELKKAITDVLQEDPRSNYRRDKCDDRLYFFNVDCVKVTCWFDEDFSQVLKVSQISKTSNEV